jgi:hypothetical protein
MNLIAFIFHVLKQTVPIETKDYNQMLIDAHGWYDKIDEGEGSKSKSWEIFVKKWGSDWRVRVVLAFASIWAVRELRDAMQPKSTNTADDEL